MSEYGKLSEIQQFACRVIADHARSTAFAIADGILPGNEGRNYVLRKIMRRAIYHGREHLGFNDAFFYKVCDKVIDEMRDSYPELEAQRQFIGKMVRIEEERFGNTLTVGLKKLDELFENMTVDHRVEIVNMLIDDELRQKLVSDPAEALDFMRSDSKVSKALNSDAVKESTERFGGIDKLFDEFKALLETEDIKALVSKFFSKPISETSFFPSLARLYDTYGTPRDLIRVKLEENLERPIPEELFNTKFDAALQELQQQGEIGKTERKSQISPIYAEISGKLGENAFRGYEATHIEDAEVVALVKDEKKVEELKAGEEGLIVLRETPFYAEAGGQVGDTGMLVGVENHPAAEAAPLLRKEGSFRATVNDTYSPLGGLIIHKVTVEKGSIKVGDKVTAAVDVEKRDATRRNHTATHLVHAALKEVLGSHVKQAGSVVAPTYLRFDFTHYQPMTEAEIAEIEDLVNRYILENQPVNTNIMAREEAMRGGAVALFGEKYGSDVRVLSIGDGIFSKELCGGTHVRATGDIGAFKITSDEAIASGVRRIRAITGFDAFERFREDERLIDRSLAALKTQRDNLPNAIEKLQDEVKRSRKEIEDLKLKIATGAGGTSSDGSEAKDINGVKVLAKIVEGLDANGVRQLSDTLLARLRSGVVILGRSEDGKASIIVRVSADLTGKIKAGSVIKEIVPIVAGRGGGKFDMAEGGGSEPGKLGEAIDASYIVIEKMLSEPPA